MKEIKSSINFKLFIGVLITSELKMHLNQSTHWKHANDLADPNRLTIASFENRDYLGRVFEGKLNRFKLDQLNLEIREMIKNYCCEFKIENLNSSIFTQAHIG